MTVEVSVVAKDENYYHSCSLSYLLLMLFLMMIIIILLLPMIPLIMMINQLYCNNDNIPFITATDID